MADLSKEQVTSINMILGMFEIGTFDWFTYNDRVTGEITSVPLANQVDFTTAQTRLNAIITDIDAQATVDGRQARVISIITDYDRIQFDVVKIRSGGATGSPGARYDPDEKRFHLKQQLEIVLGFALRQENAPSFRGRSAALGR